MCKEPFVVPASFPKFELGRVVMTRSVADLVDSHSLNPQHYLWMHVNGNFGQLCEEDIEVNMEALENGGRIFSSYDVADILPVEKIWIITEHDRSVTTLLLPSDY